MRRIGIGHRGPLAPWIDSQPAEIDCVEVVAEHFAGKGATELRALRRKYPLMVHGVGLSLGTPGPLDTHRLASFRDVARAAEPLWVSEHVAFTRSGARDLGHLNPVRPDTDSLGIMVEHAREVSEACGVRLLVENITSHLRLAGPMRETDFLNRLCERSGCGLLLDVTNVVVNAHNHGFDAHDWIRELDPKHVVQLHIVGYRPGKVRWEDLHADAIQEEVFAVTETVLAHADPEAIILERDASFPPVSELACELKRVRALG
jgi:uncharacterized protein (UPF0276 family)